MTARKTWEAVTESGAVYRSYEDGFVVHVGRLSSESYRWPIIKAVPDVQPSTMPALMDAIEMSDAVDVPTQGKRIYLSSARGWRLSTPVVSIQIFDEEERS